MAYQAEQVRRLLTESWRHGGPATLAPTIGQAESSADSVHHAAIEFWTLALALEGDGALVGGDRVFAKGELARHTKALEPPAMAPWPRAQGI